MNSFITSIATANPPYKIGQQEAFRFMTDMYGMDHDEAEKLKRLYRATGIQSRYSVIPDYQTINGDSFFSQDHDSFPTTAERLALFQKEAIKLCIESCRKLLKDIPPERITHLITVSCTGMYAPGIDIELVDHLGLNSNVERTGINFMGCYAAFNAIKVADTICAAHDDAVVLIVCVELCSIHVQKRKLEDYLLANALFGDGAAALIMQSQPAKGLNLKTASFYNDLYRDGHDDMAWKIGDFGFEMRLSAYVPAIIESGIGTMIHRLMDKGGISHFDYYAIHPGGKKILQVIEKELKLRREDIKAAYDVLRDYGNMSSPTVLFVLKHLFEQRRAADQGKTILSMAFGPGLTLESMLLTIFNH